MQPKGCAAALRCQAVFFCQRSCLSSRATQSSSAILIMPCTISRITSIVEANEKVLIRFESVCRAVVQFCPAVRTEYLARKDTDFSRCSRAAFVFTDFLYCFKDMPVYNVIPHTLFASVIFGGRLEVFGMPDIFQLL